MFEEHAMKSPLKTKIHPKHTQPEPAHTITFFGPGEAVFGGGFLLVFFRARKLTNMQRACQEESVASGQRGGKATPGVRSGNCA